MTLFKMKGTIEQINHDSLRLEGTPDTVRVCVYIRDTRIKYFDHVYLQVMYDDIKGVPFGQPVELTLTTTQEETR